MREDKVYTNQANDRYTTRSQEGYYNYTEWFNKYNKGYELDENQRVINLPETKTVNLSTLFEILKSHDPALLEANQWIFDGERRFLDRQSIPIQVAYNSFPRSGNTMLRRFLENITGVTTGSNMSALMCSAFQM